MTKDEARTKTCWRTLAAISDGMGGFNFASSPCIAGECMAWRERQPTMRRETVQQQVRDVIVDPGGGFCGLAGTPQ